MGVTCSGVDWIAGFKDYVLGDGIRRGWGRPGIWIVISTGVAGCRVVSISTYILFYQGTYVCMHRAQLRLDFDSLSWQHAHVSSWHRGLDHDGTA